MRQPSLSQRRTGRAGGATKRGEAARRLEGAPDGPAAEQAIPLTGAARRVLAARYLRLGPAGAPAESAEELFARVARAVAEGELAYASAAAARRWEERFFHLMSRLEFLPNSPALMNAGTRLGQLAACFVLPVEDTLDSIFDAVKHMALVQRSGGGTGFSFSRLRGNGERLASSGGFASGPVSFLRIFDAATENVRLGGRRRGANMAVLAAEHPDIEEFIASKAQPGALKNFNLSVAVSDAFMAAAAGEGEWPVRDGGAAAARGHSASAPELFQRIFQAAWASGDPGMLFLDTVNRAHPLPAPVETTNPCGEVPLLPYETCTLGSLNLTRFVRAAGPGAEMDWERLKSAVHAGMRFLDDVITVNRYPLPAIEQATLASRKAGLGVMGFAEALILNEYPYDSPRALGFAERLMRFIADEARDASRILAEERGPFPLFANSRLAGGPPLRNATQTSIAPTGTIALIAGTSTGIEPLFALAYRRTGVLGGQTLPEMNPILLRYVEGSLPAARARAVIAAVEREGRIGDGWENPGAPEGLRELFATALEIAPEAHVRMQAAFQKHVDNAVSKTVNLPAAATVDDVAAVYRLAHHLGCKGVTVFRYGSKEDAVLQLGLGEQPFEREYFSRCDPEACKL